MYIRPISKTEITEVSNIIDEFCTETKNTDYVSEKLEDNSWIVTMKLRDYRSAANLLIELMFECSFRINFITR